MGDRKPSFFNRLLSTAGGASRPRPPPATTTSAPTAAVSQSATADSSSSPTNPNPNPSTTKGQNTTASNPITSPSADVHTASKPTSHRDEPKTSSPSRATTKSPSSSPSRKTAQSRSPPQPPSSPSQRPSQPRSPSRLASHSPKQTTSSNSPKGTKQPTSPSKQTTQEISSSNEGPKPAASQQETHLKAEVKSSTANDSIDQTVNGTSFKHDEKQVVPSKSTQKLDSSTTNGGHEPLIELNAKLEETKQVQETKTEANEETKKEVNNEAQIIDKAEDPNKQDKMQKEKDEALETKEILHTSLPTAKPANTTASQPKKRSTIANTHSKSSLPTGEHVPLRKDIKDDISTFVNKMAIGGDLKSAIYDKPLTVITLAGENRGASMQMGSNSSKREGLVHIHRSYKINPDESAEVTTDGEGSSEGKKSEDQPTEAYVNNNSQGINNSILFNCAVTERNPGVHMVVTHVLKESIQSAERKTPLDTRKAEFNTTRAEKLTYEPTVRRRCLRGLFLETSDSDSEKPRHHGCRVSCQQKG